MSATKDLYFTDDDVFSYSYGLNMAVAFTSFSDITTYELPREYGELVINSYSWGQDMATGKFWTKRTKLDDHICTFDELALGTDKSGAKFYPPHPSNKSFIASYQKKFICIEPEEVSIYGDFSTAKAR